MDFQEKGGREELLWSVQELAAVRASGLVGALVGCLSRAPRQNTRLGRPLLLRREEHLLLFEEQPPEDQMEPSECTAADVLREPRPQREKPRPQREEPRPQKEEPCSQTEDPRPQTEVPSSQREQLCPETEESCPQMEMPNPQTEGPLGGRAKVLNSSVIGQKLHWEGFLSQSLEEQQELSLKERRSAVTSSLSGRVSEAELASRLLSLEQNFLFPKSALAVQLSTCRRGLALQPIRRENTELQPIKRENMKPKPIRRENTETQPIRREHQSDGITNQRYCSQPIEDRLLVFRDLRRRGFYLTSGGKFGVDFLVYPGDPLRFHAHFMALILPAGGSMSVAELLSCVRLSSNVKKTLLLCSVSPPGGVLYSSLQWSRMS